MSFAKSETAKRKEIEELARHWGELLAREAHPKGPGLDVSLADMEEMVACATRAIVQGAIGVMTEDQAQLLDEEQPCPTCGKACAVRRKSRAIAVRGGSAELDEPVAHCSKCRRDFFPSAAAEADARGFYRAKKRAFVADGQAYNWAFRTSWFSDFTPIVDFVHVIEYVYEAAKAIHSDEEQWWPQHVTWATACWQGRVDDVIGELHQWQSRLGPVPDDASDTAPSKVVSTTITYLTNNRTRMDYPRYRQEGLPVTSSLAESLVKQISKRVKGTDMFWDDGPSGEAILRLRAAVISDGQRLAA